MVLGSWACGTVSDSDTLSGLDCTTGQLASFDSTLGAWACSDPSAGVGGTSGLRSTAADLTVGESDGGAPFASLDTPLSIPDDNTFGVTSTRYVADADTVETISVDIEVTHGDMSQITVILGSPTGTEITLYSAGEEGSADLNTNIGWVTAPATGDLYSFFDENPVGTWTLQVIDAGAGTEGTLDTWTLRINEEWDGTAFVGQSLTVQGKAEVRGQLTMAAGAPIVFSDVDGDETMRINPTGMTPLYKMAGGCVSSSSGSEYGVSYGSSQALLTLSATCSTRMMHYGGGWSNCAGTGRTTSGITTCTNTRVGSMLLGD
jgi:subtilisin-like proprotein convertase family protein